MAVRIGTLPVHGDLVMHSHPWHLLLSNAFLNCVNAPSSPSRHPVARLVRTLAFSLECYSHVWAEVTAVSRTGELLPVSAYAATVFGTPARFNLIHLERLEWEDLFALAHLRRACKASSSCSRV